MIYPKQPKQNASKKKKALREKNASIPFPDWDVLQAERTESNPQVMFLIKDERGNPVRWLAGASENGLHRSNWDLRVPAPHPVNLNVPTFQPPWAGDPQGPLVAPGKYTVELLVEHNGKLESQGSPQSFTVKPVPTLEPDTDFQAIASFQQKTHELLRQVSSASRKMFEVREQLRYIQSALKQTPKSTAEHFAKWNELNESLAALQFRLLGDPVRQQLNESTTPSINTRVQQVANGHWSTRQAPTKTWQSNMEIAARDFAQFTKDLRDYMQELEEYEAALEAVGAPYTRGRKF